MTTYIVGAGLLAVGSAGYSYRDKLQIAAPYFVEFVSFLSLKDMSQIDIASLTESATNYLPGWFQIDMPVISTV